MSKILIDEATVKLAMEAMQRIQIANMDCDFLNIRQSNQLDKAITALREALAEQPAQQHFDHTKAANAALRDAQMDVVTLKDMDAAIALVREEYRLRKMTSIVEIQT